MTRRKKKDTPISDEALRSEFPAWSDKIRARCENGKLEYGDKSFSKDPLALIEELEQECLDIPGWSFITYCRLQQMKRALTEALNRTLHDAAGQLETAADSPRRNGRPA